MLDGFLQVQPAGDFLVGMSLGEQFYHLGFAGRQ
jgi:hypothetical protein